MTQNKDLVADSRTLLEENLSEKKSVEFARRVLVSKMARLHRDCFWQCLLMSQIEIDALLYLTSHAF